VPFEIGFGGGSALAENQRRLELRRELPALAAVAEGAHLLEDAIALREFWSGTQGRSAPRQTVSGAADVDFGNSVVLAVTWSLPADVQLQWQPALRANDRWVVRLHARSAAAPAAASATSAALVARTQVFVLSRPDTGLAVEIAAVPTGVGEWQEAARFDLRAADQAKHLRVLRCADLADGGADVARVRRVTTSAEFEALLPELRVFGANVTADWADCSRETVLLVDLGEGRTDPGISLTVGQQAGADVLTLNQKAPSGEDPGAHRPRLLLKLPRRAADLLVVSRVQCGPAPAQEHALARLPALH